MENYFEIKRKLIHILIGILLLFAIFYNILTPLILAIIILLGFIAALIAKYKPLPIITWCIQQFERKNTFPAKGFLTLLFGALLAITFFSKDIALAAIAILTFGDAFSHIIGKYYGITKHPLNNAKLIEGTIAGILIGFMAALFFVSPLEAFLASFFALFFEALELKIKQYIIDDNISIPVIAAITIQIIRFF